LRQIACGLYFWSMTNRKEESTDLTLSQAQRKVDEWIRDVGVRYFSELTNMAMLTEEVGEVARIIARRYGEQSEKPSDADKVLADELADVLFVLICLANQTGVDLDEAFKKNLDKKTLRDAERHRQNPKITG
jgi:NTP pyrophosphatase (non-canonical NTP hydrolase)